MARGWGVLGWGRVEGARGGRLLVEVFSFSRELYFGRPLKSRGNGDARRWSIIDDTYKSIRNVRAIQMVAPIRAPIRAYVALSTNSNVEVIIGYRCTLGEKCHQTVSPIRARIRTKQ